MPAFAQKLNSVQKIHKVCYIYSHLKKFFLPDALNDVLDALNKEENATRLDEARESAGNDMLKAMQLVFPLATQIEMGVIDKYGFVGNGEGKVTSFICFLFFLPFKSE